MLFGLAQLEQEYRHEHQAAGIEVAKQKGLYRGRGKGTTKARPARADTLRRRGLTVSEIAAALDVSSRTVFRYLASSSA